MAERFAIQYDWLEALEDGDSFWASLYHGAGVSKSIHGKINAKLFSHDFNVERIKKRELKVEHCGFETTFKFADKVFRNGTNLLHFLEVSPAESLAICAVANGLIFIDTDTKEVTQTVSFRVTPNLVRFFPSGKVLAVVGHNQIHVCDLATCLVARTFVGHRQEITTLEFIETGRNFVTSSRDGSVKIWETASGEEVGCLRQGFGEDVDSQGDSVNCLGVYSTGNYWENSAPKKYFFEKEHVCCFGTDSGNFTVSRVPHGEVLFEHKCSSGVNSLSCTDKFVVIGCEDGTIGLLSTCDFSYREFSFHAHSIRAIALRKSQVFVSFASTGVAVFEIVDNNLTPRFVELSGSDCEPIIKIINRPSGVWTSARDGYIRFYHC